MRYAATAVLLAMVSAGAASAQTAPAVNPDTVKLRPAVRMEREAEIALARSAAPASIAERASVYVLGESRYDKVVDGSIPFACIVQRGTSGQNLIPRCDEQNGVETIYPVFDFIEEMRNRGAMLGEVRRAIEEGYRTGRFKAPRFGGISYMYSTDVVFPGSDGRNIPFSPHVMFYWPNCKVEDLGMSQFSDMRGTGMSFLGLGSPECYLLVNTPEGTGRKVEPSR